MLSAKLMGMHVLLQFKKVAVAVIFSLFLGGTSQGGYGLLFFLTTIVLQYRMGGARCISQASES